MDTISQMAVLPFENAEKLGGPLACAFPREDSEKSHLVLHLYNQFHARILKYALTFGIPFHDAEDIVQETFFSLFRHLELDRPRSNLAGWLFRVTHNLALKRRAGNQSISKTLVSHQPLDNYPGPGCTAESDLVFNRQQRQLRSIWQVLPPTDRHCLYLRAEGLKYREIAEVVGISLGAVAASLSKSLARMSRVTGGE